MLPLGPLLAALSTPAASDVPRAGQAEARPAVARSLPETSVLGGLGAMGGDKVGGLAFSALLTHRYDLLEVGVEADAGVMFASVVGVGGVLGLHLGNEVSLRVLVAGGVHHYERVGAGLLSDDPGVSGSLPYVGQRLLLGYSFGRKTWRNRVQLGLLGAVDLDLGRQTNSVTYVQHNWLFDDSSHEDTSTHTIGQTSVWGLLMAGVELDLAPY